MNNCTFTGYLLHDPQIETGEANGGPSCCVFKMVVYEYRKSKGGQKQRIPTTLTFEAWASGAETIAKLAQKGTKMTLYCSARNGVMKTDSVDDTIFRVNEFDFACLDKD